MFLRKASFLAKMSLKLKRYEEYPGGYGRNGYKSWLIWNGLVNKLTRPVFRKRAVKKGPNS